MPFTIGGYKPEFIESWAEVNCGAEKSWWGMAVCVVAASAAVLAGSKKLTQAEQLGLIAYGVLSGNNDFLTQQEYEKFVQRMKAFVSPTEVTQLENKGKTFFSSSDFNESRRLNHSDVFSSSSSSHVPEIEIVRLENQTRSEDDCRLISPPLPGPVHHEASSGTSEPTPIAGSSVDPLKSAARPSQSQNDGQTIMDLSEDEDKAVRNVINE